MRLKSYRFTPARGRALAKARQVAIRRKLATPNKAKVGKTRRANVVKYARANQRSGTIGFNAGYSLGKKYKGTSGAYARFERKDRIKPFNSFISSQLDKRIDPNSKVGMARSVFSRRVTVESPNLWVSGGHGVKVKVSPTRKAGLNLNFKKVRNTHGDSVKSGASPTRVKFGTKKYNAGGRSEVKANFSPYTRINQQGITVGYNTGAGIPFSKFRISNGAYSRVERRANDKPVTSFVKGKASRVIPNTKLTRGIAKAKKDYVSVSPSGRRVSVNGYQARMGTSRTGGKTLVIRKGLHPVSPSKTVRGVQSYNEAMESIYKPGTGKRKKARNPRPQRRGK